MRGHLTCSTTLEEAMTPERDVLPAQLSASQSELRIPAGTNHVNVLMRTRNNSDTAEHMI